MNCRIYKRYFVLFFLLFFIITPVRADALEEAKSFILNDEYDKAKSLLESASQTNASLKNNSNFLFLFGVCEFETGNYDEAKRLLTASKTKTHGLANLYLGKLAYLNYDLDEAADFLDEYKKYLIKNKIKDDYGMNLFERQLELAESSFDRVEKIVIIDSISVPKNDFFQFYSLPESAGRLISSNSEEISSEKALNVSFISEDGDYEIWSEPNAFGNLILLDSYKLIDKGWEKPQTLPETINSDGNTAYPFLNSDGTTLYFASDGENSLGGYDIFIAQRDPVTGEYRQPLNLGMPYNSPYDDYMMAIDEENGIGWWATDRNNLGENITIYVFKVNESRENYDPEEENLQGLAILSDYKETQKEFDKQNLKELKNIIAHLDKREKSKNEDFVFPLSNGKVYTSSGDFSTREAQRLVPSWQSQMKTVGNLEKEMRDLRYQYSLKPSQQLKTEIGRKEIKLDEERKKLSDLENQLYKAEKK